MIVDLILTSDWHLRDDVPSCRIDNFEGAQWDKVEQVSALQRQFNCPVLHAGDLFHHWKPSPYLLSKAIQHLPNRFYTVAGQHDLPQHSLDLYNKCGLYTLYQAKALDWLEESGNFGQGVGEIFKGDFDRKVGVWHHFVWDGKNVPWPDCTEITARKVLRSNPGFDLIVTGDYHKPFTYEYKGRLLVNCGCLTRQAADYDNHRPRVWLWNAQSNSVRPHYLKIQKDVINRDHIQVKEERDKRMDAFIERLSDDWEISVSFEENLKRFTSSNKIRKSVVDLVYKAIGT